jgi:2-polyprenyl-3-methyl-5-hydroxy-6-metoxy-1,4-benzoquinol methylase
MNRSVIRKQLLELEPRIREAFGQPRTDYRGRVIDLDHVLRYFYHDIYRMTELTSLVLRYSDASARICDVGIAYGFFDVVLKSQYQRDITGMDLPQNIQVYCDLPKAAGIPLLAGELGVKDCPVETETYDLVILGEVLEHMRISPMRALMQLSDMLRPGGYLLLTTPNIACLDNIAKLIVGHNILEEFPDDDTKWEHITDSLVHIREYTMTEVRALLQRSGFVVKRTQYSWSWDRYNRYLLDFEDATVTNRLQALLRAGISLLLPWYRREMMLLARKAG